jgi:hypothetical protein
MATHIRKHTKGMQMTNLAYTNAQLTPVDLSDYNLRLEIATARKRETNGAFQIPSHQERMNLQIGDAAQIIFTGPPVDGMFAGERVWVRVKEIYATGCYIGELANRMHVYPELAYKSLISFYAENVINRD